MRARCTLASIALLVCGVAHPASAQTADPGPSGGSAAAAPASAPNATREAAAQALFDEAVKLMEAHRYPEACERFASSQKLDPGAGTLLNLGTCYEKNGQTASAWATFVEAASVATKAGHADWAARAQEKVTALEPKLARVTVAVPPDSAVDGLIVERNTLHVDAGSYGSAIPVDPGQYTFTASAPHRKPWSSTVTVDAGARQTVTVPALELEAVVLAPLPGAATHAPSFWSTGRIVGTALGAAGLVGIGVGSVLGLEAKSDYDDARSNDCPKGGTLCNSAGVQLGQSASSLAAGSTAAFLVSGALLAGGATLFLVGGPKASQRGSLRVSPQMGGRSVGAGLEGAW
jgi:hypothetical protein